jgi:predicted acylesterase/phospholipase RssA
MAERRESETRTGLDECDLVMKGGITSGVVYPSAVLRLKEKYRFRSIGGASVGAIAAAVTAAAEYGRQTGKGAGFDQLRLLNQQLGREGFLLSLFKPRPEARGVFAIYLAAAGKKGALHTAMAVIRQAPWVLVPLLAWWGTLAITAVLLGGAWWLVPALLVGWALLIGIVVWALGRKVTPLGPLLGGLLVLLWPLIFAAPSVALGAWRDLSGGGFGLVPGSSATGDGLCDWLHGHVQDAAGLPEDRPLTFGMLREDAALDGKPVGIELRMMTTNLSTARPMTVPDELAGYAFAPADLAGVLPAKVLAWMERNGTPDGTHVRLPPDQIPVLLGFRLSLSFPLLFTALRLHAPSLETPQGPPVEHWFSDGGIGSNFPVHFFDAWIPTRPTFALSFASFPVDESGRLVPGESDVGIPPKPGEIRFPRWTPVGDMGAFVAQILETMQNWRDTMQAELPGFRDRVYEARLVKEAGEGGLNLGMDAATIKRLQYRGTRVGEAIAETFDWNQHFFTRYLIAMQQLELGLIGNVGEVGSALRRGVHGALQSRLSDFAAGDIRAGELFGRDATWLRQAGAASWEMLQAAERWAAFGRFLSDQPRPRPSMRIVPDV